jgi:L-lactate dehydrogenase (cytochrome)
VLRALALGARGCLIERAHLYGLAAMGEMGVTLAIEIIRRELETTMALRGLRDIGEIGRDAILEPDRRNN